MKTDSLFAQELRALTDVELNRSQPDLGLVEACVDTILELDAIEPETDEEVRAGIESVLQQKPKPRKRRVLRRALIAAVVIILIMAMSISMMPLGTNDESLLHRWGFFFLQKYPGYRVDYNDYVSIIYNGETKNYSTIRQFIRKTHIDTLVPTKLPEGYRIRRVVVMLEPLKDCPSVHFFTFDPKVVIITYIGRAFDEFEGYERVEQIGGFNCGIAAADSWYQCDFNFGENGYSVCAHSYDDLVTIVENLKSGLELYGQGK